MKLLGIDTETTGLEQAKGHRIIEIAMILVQFDGSKMQVEDRLIQRINPERSIDPDAQAVHKIGAADLVGKPTWNHVAPSIVNMMNRADVLIAHNMAFDGPFIAAELLRIGITPPSVPVFCTMENARWATGHGKLPKLSELCWSLFVDYDPAKAHAAEYDVLVMLQCLKRGLASGHYQIPVLTARKAA
jgi:DNA polymerase-3 subunit epsilon